MRPSRSLCKVLRSATNCSMRKSKHRHKHSPTIHRYVKSRPQTRSQSKSSQETHVRPHRKAASTTRYTFRYLQTGNPGRLEENDLKRALSASLEESRLNCQRAKKQQMQQTEKTRDHELNIVSTGIATRAKTRSSIQLSPRDIRSSARLTRRVVSSRPMSVLCNNDSQTHQYDSSSGSECMSKNNDSNIGPNEQQGSNNNMMPFQTHRRYRPVAKKHIYQEADFFHEGIMEYIEYALLIA